jgi:hypothetical protein
MTPHTIAPVEEREEVDERQDGKKIEVNCKVGHVERLVSRQRRNRRDDTFSQYRTLLFFCVRDLVCDNLIRARASVGMNGMLFLVDECHLDEGVRRTKRGARQERIASPPLHTPRPFILPRCCETRVFARDQTISVFHVTQLNTGFYSYEANGEKDASRAALSFQDSTFSSRDYGVEGSYVCHI